MLKRDINSRFEDWLLNPNETLDFEVKRWLDLTDAESQGLVAKTLIALENHGGGFLLFGYFEDANKKLVPDPKRPESLEPYLSDALNSIVKRRAEPSFNVEVTLQRHPETKLEYPLVRVLGRSKVPVRSNSATPQGTLKQHVYYIRGPGPESRSPLTAAEWDELLRRAVANQREEIIALLCTIFPNGSVFGFASQPSEMDHLNRFVSAALVRWNVLNNSLPADHPARMGHGYYHFGARIVGKPSNASAKAILQANDKARRYTGWPAFISGVDDQSRPKLVEGQIEAWLALTGNPDVGYADFWRIEPEGNFFLLRGYQEDSARLRQQFGEPGTILEATLPMWRLGEFLLRVVEIGEATFEQDFEVCVSCEWHGLKGRKLFSHNMRRTLPGPLKSSQDEVCTAGQFSAAAIRDLLPDVVKALTGKLYEHFDFYEPPDSMYKEELGEMLKNRY